MQVPRNWMWISLVMLPIPLMFYNGAYASDIQSSANEEILLSTYEVKKQELDRFVELHELLETSTTDEKLIDQALFQLLTTKISMVETELTQLKAKFWDIPLTELLNLKLPKVEYSLDKVDMDKVKAAWLTWVNDLRASKGLHPYKYHTLLDHTSQEVALYLADKYPSGRVGNMETHEKPGQSQAGYSHSYMTKWFQERGVYPVKNGRSNHSENTGYSDYSCRDDDCTDEMIASLKRTFRYYMSEERYANYAPSRALHYLSLINPRYQYIGLGLSVGDGSSRRWSVVHYMTELEDMDIETIKEQRYAKYLPL